MDILSNLNISRLPEQQTRTTHPNIITALSSSSSSSHPEEEIRLGFTHCCYCAGTPTIVSCHKCHCVKYCSDDCRRNDKRSSYPYDDDNDDGNNEMARGHTAIICSLLKSCRDDEEEELRMIRRHRQQQQQQQRKSLSSTNPPPSSSSSSSPSNDRIISELQSYPATLSQILSTSSSSTYQTALSRARKSSSFSIHVIGATKRAELWTSVNSTIRDAGMAYVDALTDIIEMMNLKRVTLLFIGEGLSSDDDDEEDEGGESRKTEPVTTTTTTTEDISWKHSWTNDSHSARKKTKHEILIRTKTCSYHERNDDDDDDDNDADMVCFFNPGFTCNDYEWNKTLESISSGTPFFVTSNTEMEAVMDCQFLYDGGFIPALPRVVKEMMRIEEDDDDDDDEEGNNGSDEEEEEEEDLLFFGENPYCGSRVRQSGNMANDVFVKSRFVFGGVFSGEMMTAAAATANADSQRKKRDEKIKEEAVERGDGGGQAITTKKKKKMKKRRGDDDDDDDGESRRKIKKKNPAFI